MKWRCCGRVTQTYKDKSTAARSCVHVFIKVRETSRQSGAPGAAVWLVTNASSLAVVVSCFTLYVKCSHDAPVETKTYLCAFDKTDLNRVQVSSTKINVSVCILYFKMINTEVSIFRVSERVNLKMIYGDSS